MATKCKIVVVLDIGDTLLCICIKCPHCPPVPGTYTTTICYCECIIPTQYLAQCSLHQTMDVSHTVLVLLDLPYQLILWLPTVVTQATLVLVTVLEPVSLIVHGVVVHQHARVSHCFSLECVNNSFSLYRTLSEPPCTNQWRHLL